MELNRLFSYDKYKGSFGYLDTQRKYEIARTVLYFAISFGIFFIGMYLTGTRKNLLTIVAVLGMLPAAKSLVSVIMFARFKSFDEKIDTGDTLSAYDMVFTSEKKNYQADHLCISDNCIVGYTRQSGFDEAAFKEHITTILSSEKITGITVKIFTDRKAYLNRISSLGPSDRNSETVMTVLKQIVL